MTVKTANPCETLSCIGFVPRNAYKSLDALSYSFQFLNIGVLAFLCHRSEQLSIRVCLKINQFAHASALQYLQHVVSCISYFIAVPIPDALYFNSIPNALGLHFGTP